MKFSELMAKARAENHLCSVLLELTYRCNLACQFCYNDVNLQGRPLGIEDYKKLVDDLYDMGVMGLTFTGGEPMVYPHFWTLGAYAREKRFSIIVKTNGLPLNQRNCQRLIEELDPWMIETSLHGADAETHDKQTLQPGSFQRLIRNIRLARELGLRIRANSTLTSLNEHQVAAMFDLCDDLGISLNIDPDVTPKDDGDQSPLALAASEAGIENMFRISLGRASKAMQGKDRIPVKLSRTEAKPEEQPLKNCGAGSTNVAIDPFGNVYPCVQFRRKAGNLHQQTIAEIWNQSQALTQVRSLAYQARETALEQGLENYCMGTAELHTGSPLKIHHGAIRNNDIFNRARQKETEEEPAS